MTRPRLPLTPCPIPSFEDGSPVKTPEDGRSDGPNCSGSLTPCLREDARGPARSDALRVTQDGEGIPRRQGHPRGGEDHFSEKPDGPFLDLLVIKPSKTPEGGVRPSSDSISREPRRPSLPRDHLSTAWMRREQRTDKKGQVVDHRATEASRGNQASRWPLEKIVDAGCALATFYYGDIDPDFDDGFENGIHALFGKPGRKSGVRSCLGLGRQPRSRLPRDRSLHRQNPCCRLRPFRLGKTALWAGAQDERFAWSSQTIRAVAGPPSAAAASASVSDGSTRPFPIGLPTPSTNTTKTKPPARRPAPARCLIAPRLVYVASAVEDQWADPKGEFLSAKHAGPVYELLGKKGVGVEENARPERTRRRQRALPHPHRETRCDRLRLGPVSEGDPEPLIGRRARISGRGTASGTP